MDKAPDQLEGTSRWIPEQTATNVGAVMLGACKEALLNALDMMDSIRTNRDQGPIYDVKKAGAIKTN